MAAYTDATYYKAYFDARGVDVSSQTDIAIDAALLVSTEFLDDTYDFMGERTVSTQDQKFPRTNLYNSDNISIDSATVPAKVKDCSCELAYIQQTQTGGLQPLFDGQVVKKAKDRLGQLETEREYDADASAAYERYYAKAVKKISDFLISPSSNSIQLMRVI
jgi:hypothetical protein